MNKAICGISPGCRFAHPDYNHGRAITPPVIGIGTPVVAG
jgi:hypothetical protein